MKKTEKLTIDLVKAQVFFDADGGLTKNSMKLVQQYASRWVRSFERDLALRLEKIARDEFGMRHPKGNEIIVITSK